MALSLSNCMHYLALCFGLGVAGQCRQGAFGLGQGKC